MLWSVLWYRCLDLTINHIYRLIHFKKITTFNCRKVRRVQLSSNFFLLLSLKYYREEKQVFERILIFLNIKILAKSNKIELSDEFMAMWRDKQTLWDVTSSLCETKMKKTKVWKECQINFINFKFFRLIFSNKKFCFKCKKFF